MPRTFHPNEIIRLPQTTAAQAVALGTSIVSRGEERQPLPALLDASHQAVREAVHRLRDGWNSRARNEADSQQAREADVQLDAVWGALYHWLNGWSRLPASLVGDAESSPARVAQRVLAALFPDGLRFLNLPFREEWVASQSLIARIQADNLDRSIAQLGGATILDALERAHAEYGHALGITEGSGADPSPPISLRELVSAFQTALRAYVVRVVATVEPDDEVSEQLAAYLLKPLVDWRRGRSASSEDDEVADEESSEGASEEAEDASHDSPEAGSDDEGADEPDGEAPSEEMGPNDSMRLYADGVTAPLTS